MKKATTQNLVILVVVLVALGSVGWQMSDVPPQEGYRVGQIRKAYVLPKFCLALTFNEKKGQIR